MPPHLKASLVSACNDQRKTGRPFVQTAHGALEHSESLPLARMVAPDHNEDRFEGHWKVVVSV